MSDFFENISSTSEDYGKPSKNIEEIKKVIDDLLSIEYKKDGSAKAVYADDVEFDIKITTKDNKYTYNSLEGGSEYLLYLLLAFYERQKDERTKNRANTSRKQK